MAKKIISIIFILFFGAISLQGFSQDTLTITDFDEYKDLTHNPQSIKVVYMGIDTNEEYIITDLEQINDIVTVLFEETTYTKASKDMQYGDNTHLFFIDEDGKSTPIHMSQIKDGEYYYRIDNTKLKIIVEEICNNL